VRDRTKPARASLANTLAGGVAAATVALVLAACSNGAPPENEAAQRAGDGTDGTNAAHARPTPRYPDGTVRFDRVPGEHGGYWGEASVSSMFEEGVDVPMDERGILENIDDAARVAPFRPWALALYRYRQSNELKDDPTRFCLPPAGPRHLQVDGGFRILQDRNYQRVFVIFGGGNRNWRIIFLDGREPPDPAEITGTYYGNSVGHWEDDTLVVDSTGFNSRFWFSNGGLPHTEALHLTERFSRPDFDTLRYEVTVDDPLTYTRPWTAAWTVDWVDGGEIKEHFCEDDRDR
jgi:hypothetical protein